MYLEQLLDLEKLHKHIEDGLVSTQDHPRLSLRIFNYSQKAQFAPVWGDGVIDYCRGLIVDKNTNEIIARPFKKFHNLNTASIPETLEENLRGTPAITEKMDGSLIILARHEGETILATRGSFESDQSKWATEWYKNHEKEFGPLEWPLGWTPLFEVIYPENRIVVDYGEFKGIVLLGMVNIDTGAEMPYDLLDCWARDNEIRCVHQYPNVSLSDLCKINRPNEEGFVVTYTEDIYKEPVKVKIKMEDYVRLHKLLTGLSPKAIWELMSSGGGGFWDIVNSGTAPEHFIKWLLLWQKKLQKDFDCIFESTRQTFAARPIWHIDQSEKEYRKDFALYVQSAAPKEWHGILFGMLDGHDPAPMIWKLVKPRGDDKSFRVEGE